VNAALRPFYAAAAQLARLGATVAPDGAHGSKFMRTFAARRGIRERYLEWGATSRDRTRGLLWMHAPSVGEGLQARPILEVMRAARPDLQLAYSYYSPSAERFALGLDVDFRDYLPFDTGGDARAALDALAPTALVFSKLDVWPTLAHEAARRGVRLGLVSATLAANSSRRKAWAATWLRDAYAAMDAVGITSDGKTPGEFQLAHTKGSSFLSVRALAGKAKTNINIRWNKHTYVFELVESDMPVLSLNLEDRAVQETIPPAPFVTPTRLLALLDKAKAFPLLKKQHPEAVADATVKAFGDHPQITEFADYEIRLEELFRFNPEDTLVFHVTLRNKSDQEIRYLPESFAVRVGNRLYYQSIGDAPGGVGKPVARARIGRTDVQCQPVGRRRFVQTAVRHRRIALMNARIYEPPFDRSGATS